MPLAMRPFIEAVSSGNFMRPPYTVLLLGCAGWEPTVCAVLHPAVVPLRPMLAARPMGPLILLKRMRRRLTLDRALGQSAK